MPLPDTPWIQNCSSDSFENLIQTTTDLAEQRALLHARGEVDVAHFARTTIPHLLRVRFATFHHQLFDWQLKMSGDPATRLGRRFAMAAPRGAAKSTVVSLLLPLHDIAYARERYVLLISATQRQAEQRLSALRTALNRGGNMARWFPAVVASRVARTPRRVLEVHGLRVEALGAGAEMRGISWEGWRPTKIVLDDAESSAAAESPRRRQHLFEWFTDVVEHLGSPATHLLVVGTILHEESLLARVLARPDVESLRLRAIEEFAPPSALWDEWHTILTDPAGADRRARARDFFLAHRNAMEAGTRVLWPEREDYEQLAAQRVLLGWRAFAREKQNEPVAPEGAVFRPDAVWRARPTGEGWMLLAPGGSGTLGRSITRAGSRRVGALDSAMGRGGARGRGDYAALAVVVVMPDGLMIAAEGWVRRAAPSAQVAALLDRHEAEAFTLVGLEGGGFQQLVCDILNEEQRRRRAVDSFWRDVPVRVTTPSRAKAARIAALEPLLGSGRLVLSETLDDEFWREMAEWPRCEHDDALDALAAAVDLARTIGQSTGNAAMQRVAKRTITRVS